MPNKTCPSCGAVVHNRTKKCKGTNNDGSSCGYVWGAAEAATAAAAVALAEAENAGERRTSRRGQGLSAQIVPAKEKDLADYTSDAARARNRDSAAAWIARRAATRVTCCGDGGCGETKRADEFSWTERKKPAPRCIACLASRTVEVLFDVSIRAADGTDMATIEVSDDSSARRWKVVAIGTVDKVKDELESATRDRALQTLRDAISRRGSAYANVVRVDDAPTDCKIGVFFKEDAAGLYATEEAVRGSLAATEGGTRARYAKLDGTQEKLFNDDDCDFMKAARDLLDPARSRLAFAATMRHVRGEPPEPGDGDFYLFARKASWPSRFDPELPDMKNDIFIVECAVPGPGRKTWNFYASTAEEALENCLRQGKCNILAQVYGVTDKVLLAQIAAGHVEKLADLNLQAEVYSEHLAADVERALKGLPFDVKDMEARNWKSRRLRGASMAAAGVKYVRGDGGGFVYETTGPNPQRFYKLKDAIEYALKDSPTLMKLQRDAMLKKGYLEELLDAIASKKRQKKLKASSTSSGSNSKAPSENYTKIISAVTKRLAELGSVEGVDLVASDWRQLRPAHVGYHCIAKTAHPKAKALYDRAVQEVGALTTFDQEEVLRVFNRLAAEDGYLTEVLRDTYQGKLNEKQYSFLSKHVVFAATFPHDIAPMESIRLMPKALAKFTRAFPGYWTKPDCQWNSCCYNIAVHHFNFAILHEETRREFPDEMER